MTIDVEEILNYYWSIHTSWIMSIKILIIFLMLYEKLKEATLNGFYVFVASFIFNIIVTSILRIFFNRMLKIKDERISL